MSKSSTVMAKLRETHPEDFLLYPASTTTPVNLVGFQLYALLTSFDLMEEEYKETPKHEVAAKTHELIEGCSNDDADKEEDWVRCEETHKDCRGRERRRKLFETHPEDFLLYPASTTAPVDLVGFQLYALLSSFDLKEDEYKETPKHEVAAKRHTLVEGCSNDDADKEEDWVRCEETHKDCRGIERRRKLLKQKLARKNVTGRKK